MCIRDRIQIRLEEIPFEQGGSTSISTPLLKVQGEKAGSGTSNTALGTLGAATQGAMLGGLISRSGRGAGIGAAAGAGIAILSGMMQTKGSNSDVNLASGSIFETKLERPITIANPKGLAKSVPTPAAQPSTPSTIAANTSTSNTAVVVSAPDPGVSSDSRPEESHSSTVPSFEPLPGEASAPAAPDSTRPAEPVAVTRNESIKAATLSVDVNLIQVDAV